eukprot:GHVS01078961.1.p1 GENE.GHVS01078961.1~~GHVS01078961.1.p1  ORF type:complete len:921 (+),score=193.14 GHVS01078961.1:386-3148(+)
MRVRHLQTYLSEHKLLRSAKLDGLRGMRVGVDAVYWLRTLQGLKDPLADPIGGLPPSLFGVLDQQIELFHRHEIHPVFVFQGMQPRSHMLFSSQLHQQMDEAWLHYARGDTLAAQAKFAQATSRINSDFVQFIFHYLLFKNCECFQAPYFATAQLAYFVQQDLFDALYGPPALLLFGVPRVITNVDFIKGKFEWVEQSQLLDAWQVNSEQFVDACLLAGTEYCLTFPYLNLTQFHHGQQQFTFGTAIEFIKQAPLISYMQHFPNEEMRNDHVDGYCVCKSLILFPLVMELTGKISSLKTNGPSVIGKELGDRAGGGRVGEEDVVEGGQRKDSEGESCRRTSTADVTKAAGGLALDVSNRGKTDDNSGKTKLRNSGGTTNSVATHDGVPSDYHRVVGLRLPSAIYYLMAEGVLSRKLPCVLALGEWLDYSHPTVDSDEYRDLLTELREYRCRALGLIALRMNKTFQKKNIKFSRYRCSLNGSSEDSSVDTCELDIHRGIVWKVGPKEIEAEKARQEVKKVDLLFCLRWHAHAASSQQTNNLFALPDVGGEGQDESEEERGGGSDENGRRGVVNGVDSGEAVVSKNKKKKEEEYPRMSEQTGESLMCLVHFMLLESMGFFTSEAEVTVFGSALSRVPRTLQEDILFVLELMRMGCLTGDLLEAPTDRSYPDRIGLLRRKNVEPSEVRKYLLLSRVFSLWPMQLKPMHMWGADVDFDLAAYHSIVKILKRSLRQMTEACLANILLKDISKVPCLPHGYFNPQNSSIPCFFLPRNCLGIVTKYFLEYPHSRSVEDNGGGGGARRQGGGDEASGVGGDGSSPPAAVPGWVALEKDMKRSFHCAVDPLKDLFRGIAFWDQVKKTIDYIDTVTDVKTLKIDLDEATELLYSQIDKLELRTHPNFAKYSSVGEADEQEEPTTTVEGKP